MSLSTQFTNKKMRYRLLRGIYNMFGIGPPPRPVELVDESYFCWYLTQITTRWVGMNDNTILRHWSTLRLLCHFLTPKSAKCKVFDQVMNHFIRYAQGISIDDMVQNCHEYLWRMSMLDPTLDTRPIFKSLGRWGANDFPLMRQSHPDTGSLLRFGTTLFEYFNNSSFDRVIQFVAYLIDAREIHLLLKKADRLKSMLATHSLYVGVANRPNIHVYLDEQLLLISQQEISFYICGLLKRDDGSALLGPLSPDFIQQLNVLRELDSIVDDCNLTSDQLDDINKVTIQILDYFSKFRPNTYDVIKESFMYGLDPYILDLAKVGHCLSSSGHGVPLG
ncbi:hypothetical protein SAMD00019534_015990 [Acytostelium subglobosum LB1]|uniref:hypothetical protein n=1 Tax=Acytostelium subglobosum LB1 TaxID=1410327 RepID=UPI00064508CE|nr:hypothetical protein SAMD00019534_015990 [Acytostelium subglobosum LB1]GAM18424.1 hypothetical protein SAMD00019534_015990 [Acytostelium subglobosum LB1]|eukprot:XP_012757644.1 hypothetical protein SAMD00019534_015990 [Acytostelium subglobosum LB1]